MKPGPIFGDLSFQIRWLTNKRQEDDEMGDISQTSLTNWGQVSTDQIQDL